MWCKSGILFHNCPFSFFLLVIVEKNWSSNKELTGFTEKSLPPSTLPPPLVSLPSPPIPPPCSAPPPPPPQVTMRPCSPSRLFKTLLDLLITAGVFFFSFFWARPLITFDGRVTLVLTWCLTSVPVMHCSSPQQKDLKERFIFRSFLVVLPWGRILKAFTTWFFQFSFLVTTAQSELLMNC